MADRSGVGNESSRCAPRLRPPLLLAMLLGALAAAGCGGRGARGESDPALLPGGVLPPQEPAVIALPITISLAAARTLFEVSIPAADSLDQARCTALGGVVCHQYVYHRAPFALQMIDDRFELAAALRYRGRVVVPRLGAVGSCGYAPDAMQRADVSFSTTLFWRSDWRLASRNTSLAARLLDPCRITRLDVDATPFMRRLVDAQLRELVAHVDSLIPELSDMRPLADSLWRSFQQPIPLDEERGAWLMMAPRAVSLAPVSGGAGLVRTTLVLTAQPRVELGARPPSSSRPLPALTLARTAPGLRIPVDVRLPFADVGRIATTLLTAAAAEHGLRVTDVRLRGAGDTVSVDVDVRGRIDGTFHLGGRVRYDQAARQVRFDGLSYTVESATRMSRLRVTLGAPLIRRALDEATGRGQLDLGAQLDAARHQLTMQLNRRLTENVLVGGGITDVRILGMMATEDAFVVRLLLTGQAQLFVQ